MAASLEAFLLPLADPAGGSRGQRFCVLHVPGGALRGAVLHAPAFADEMNKSRRMVAAQARALAESGYAVLLMDLEGCGDSSGEFETTSWAGWTEDLMAARDWLAQRFRAPLWLWGHRAGCLLMAELARRAAPDGGLLFWQAPASGRVLLQQFLRLAVAGELLEGKSSGLAARLKDSLAAGQSVDVAGYRLPPMLATGLGAAGMDPPATPPTLRCHWFELSATEPAAASPVQQRLAEAWSAAGHEVHARAVAGPAFWQTTEIETAPLLIQATLEGLA